MSVKFYSCFNKNIHVSREARHRQTGLIVYYIYGIKFFAFLIKDLGGGVRLRWFEGGGGVVRTRVKVNMNLVLITICFTKQL